MVLRGVKLKNHSVVLFSLYNGHYLLWWCSGAACYCTRDRLWNRFKLGGMNYFDFLALVTMVLNFATERAMPPELSGTEASYWKRVCGNGGTRVGKMVLTLGSQSPSAYLASVKLKKTVKIF